MFSKSQPVMEDQRDNKLICHTCGKNFSSTSVRNRHIKKIHPEIELAPPRKKRIICPLCRNEEFSFHRCLVQHLTDHHGVKINKSLLNFPNFEEFTAWKAMEDREVDYACQNTSGANKGTKYFVYNCNRSDTKGFVSTCKKRRMKEGGTIKINGVCPSRIEAKVLKNGEVVVNFTQTHVGHENELRSKRLSKTEEKHVADQLIAGVSTNRILQDARIIHNNELKRINLMTDADLSYLKRKFNIDKQRHEDDMIATSMKVEEWNRQGKNYGFLFKKIGDSYPDLRNEDFAVGFMNGIMEKKLIENCKTICIDGTHGTNQRNWDLTTLLIKDEMNKGFPVAYLLSNRLDQKIQEVFLTALQSRLGRSIEAEYIMSDDDPKYHNAWVKVMDPQKKSRRLLCTWHVVKNWNIQGRIKIRDETIRKGMKTEMRKILQETSTFEFERFKNDYLKFLEDVGENDFLKYLKTYYFQTNERIMMWAHCYRVNAGINTNMAIESLNKYLKYNKMNGKRNLRVEKLLDILEEIVDEKMWKKIVQQERPNANTYQHKVNMGAHERAENMEGEVEIVEGGNFQVKSTSERDKFYTISSNELCDADCRSGYCSECKICLHRYRCNCSSNSIKTVLCKHIHSVGIFRKRMSDYDSNAVSVGEDHNLEINEPSTSRVHYNNDVDHFIEEMSKTQESRTLPNSKEQEIRIAQLTHYAKFLNMEQLDLTISTVKSMACDQNELCRKRKHEKQTYYPRKK